MTDDPTHEPDRSAERTDEGATTAFRVPDEAGPHPAAEVPYYEAPAYPGRTQDVGSQGAGSQGAGSSGAGSSGAGSSGAGSRSAVSPPLVPEPADDEGHVATVPRGTTDLGLLLLRVALGVVLLAHGSQKLFALFDGPGINGFEGLLDRSGYQHAHLLAYVGSITEVGAGVFLVLGLLTPLAGAAALGTTINAWLVADLAAPGFRFFVSAQGQEYEVLLVALAAVVVLLGPGRFSLDRRRGWATRPLLSSWLCLALGVASGLLVWFLLNGATPFA